MTRFTEKAFRWQSGALAAVALILLTLCQVSEGQSGAPGDSAAAQAQPDKEEK